MVDLPTLDGVLSHDAVDGKHIVRNIKPLARLVRLARHTGGPDAQGMCGTGHTMTDCVCV